MNIIIHACNYAHTMKLATKKQFLAILNKVKDAPIKTVLIAGALVDIIFDPADLPNAVRLGSITIPCIPETVIYLEVVFTLYACKLAPVKDASAMESVYVVVVLLLMVARNL